MAKRRPPRRHQRARRSMPVGNQPQHIDQIQGLDVVVATADLVGRAGASDFEIGFLHPDRPSRLAGWYAHAQYRGARIIAEDHPGPAEAAQALALRLLLGAKCTGCGGVVTTDSLLIGIAENAHLADGSTWTAQQALEAGICYWRVTGERWTQGCEPIGERCPVCTHAAALILPGQGDAFCDNDKCRLLKWSTGATFNDFMRDNFEGNIKEINLHNSGEERD